MRIRSVKLTCATLLLATTSVTAQTKDWSSEEAAAPENPMKNAYFGELHVHTSYSLDAFIGGNRQTPDMAYKFAKGETTKGVGQDIQNAGQELDNEF